MLFMQLSTQLCIICYYNWVDTIFFCISVPSSMSKAAVSGACRLVKSRIEGSTLCDFKLYYKAPVIKIACLPQNRNIGQRNRVESPEINSGTHYQFMIKRLSKYSREDTIFNKWHRENWTRCKRMKLDHYFTPNKN